MRLLAADFPRYRTCNTVLPSFFALSPFALMLVHPVLLPPQSPANATLQSYDLVSVFASNEKMFHACCSHESVDIVVIEASRKLPFYLKKPAIKSVPKIKQSHGQEDRGGGIEISQRSLAATVNPRRSWAFRAASSLVSHLCSFFFFLSVAFSLALERGIHFEFSYAPAIRGAQPHGRTNLRAAEIGVTSRSCVPPMHSLSLSACGLDQSVHSIPSPFRLVLPSLPVRERAGLPPTDARSQSRAQQCGQQGDGTASAVGRHQSVSRVHAHARALHT